MQVQNKLDGCYYAVKRIQVNPASKQFRRIKGEVTLLSRLNHENIVRYYNAWIERHELPSTGVLSNSDSSEPQSTADREPQRRDPPQRFNELGLADNVEDIAPPPALSSSVEWSTSIERSSSAKCSGHQSSDEDDDDDDEDEEDVFGASFLYVCLFFFIFFRRSTFIVLKLLSNRFLLFFHFYAGHQIATRGVTSSSIMVTRAQARCHRFENFDGIIYSLCFCLAVSRTGQQTAGVFICRLSRARGW